SCRPICADAPPADANTTSAARIAVILLIISSSILIFCRPLEAAAGPEVFHRPLHVLKANHLASCDVEHAARIGERFLVIAATAMFGKGEKANLSRGERNRLRGITKLISDEQTGGCPVWLKRKARDGHE